jgi:hypothetical protein
MVDDSAMDAMRGAQGRINSLPPSADGLAHRLAVERDKHAERHRVLSLLMSRLKQWSVELRVPPGSVVELAPPLDIKLKANETAAAAIEATRKQIAGVQRDIAATRRLPMKRACQIEAMRGYLARLAERSWPKLGFDAKGNATMQWVDSIPTMDSVLGLLVFALGADQVSAAFALNLEAEAPNAISPLEREKRLAGLAAELAILESKEETLIERAGQEGQEVLRRPDASPLAVLGVSIIAAQEAAQVA